MISVIVPVYNVEPYLRKCLDSIVGQTYRELEILVIDDGSTDGSGKICDEYEERDDRIKVFHTENRGLSAARNLGLNNANGDLIGFVDSDDWIEPTMYELLLKRSEETGADVSCCGFYLHYSDHFTTHPLSSSQIVYEGEKIVTVAMEGSECRHYVWNKIYKKTLFDNCRFPEGMLFEDIATTWKLIIKSNRVTCNPEVLYHYVVRKDSLANTKTMKNLTDRWKAFKDRYDEMSSRNEKLILICTKGCLDTIGYTWRWLYATDKEDRMAQWDEIENMRKFARANRNYLRLTSLPVRISVLCAIHSNQFMIFICYYLNQLYRRVSRMDRMA